MKPVPIHVESYSGYKADEYPVSFFWDDRKHEIEEIIDRWHDRNPVVDWLATDYFKVRTEQGIRCILKHDIETDQWLLVKIYKSDSFI